jgi:hypothetical protein
MKNIFTIIFNVLIGSAITAQTVTISEINYKADKSNDPNDWLELWNYGSQTIDISGWTIQGEKFNEFYIVPDGTIMQPDQRLVFCRFDEEFEKVYPNVPYLGPFTFRLSGKGQNIRIYNESQSLFLEVAYKDSLPWPKTPDGHGKTLELKDPYGNLNDGNNWFAGCVMGSPGTAYTSCNSKIVFTEIMHSPENPINTGDWVEIKNTGNSAVDLSGWSFVNRNDTLHYFIPDGTIIEAGAYLVIARRNKFKDFYPGVNFIGPYDFGLRSFREVLKIYDKDEKIYNSMFYNNENPWPTEAEFNSKTLEIIDIEGLLCEPTNWFAGCPGGSPGSEYTNECKWATNIKEKEPIAHFSKVFPNPFSSNTTIELFIHPTLNNDQLQIQIFDCSGKEVIDPFVFIKSEHTATGKVSIKLARNQLQEGVYFYRISQGNGLISHGKLMIANR